MAYYIRRVLHDWSDEDAIRILKPIAQAMGPKSKLLIADFLIPAESSEADLAAAVMDMSMLLCAGKERTEDGFKMILEAAGLELVEIFKAPVGAGAIVEAKLKA